MECIFCFECCRLSIWMLNYTHALPLNYIPLSAFQSCYMDVSYGPEVTRVRTIQGLPLCCPGIALQHLMGVSSAQCLIQ